jgi:anti-sigma B factor antagonist
MTPDPDILVVEGEIDLHESPQMQAKLNRLIRKKPARILIDCTGLSYIDSSGIAVLIEALQRLRAQGARLKLFGVRESIRQIFDLAKLDKVFEIYGDKESALQSG